MAYRRLKMEQIREMLINNDYDKFDEDTKNNIVRTLERNAKTKVNNMIKEQNKNGIEYDSPAYDAFISRGGFKDLNTLHPNFRSKYVVSLLMFTNEDLVTNTNKGLLKYNKDILKRLNTGLKDKKINYFDWEKDIRNETWREIARLKDEYPHIFGDGGSYLDSNRVIQTIMILQEDKEDITSIRREVANRVSNNPNSDKYETLINVVKERLDTYDIQYDVKKWKEPSKIDENEFRM